MKITRDQLKNFVMQMLRPLRNRVYTMISRGVIESIKDDLGMQTVKVNILAGENRDDVEHFQPFGFSSNPPPGSECLVFAMGGDREHLIILAVNDRETRPKNLEKGESVFYNAFGDKLVLNKDGSLVGTLAKNMELTLDKFKIANGSNEFVDLVVKLADETAKGTTNTVFGPLQKNNFAAIADIKTKLETFKV